MGSGNFSDAFKCGDRAEYRSWLPRCGDFQALRREPALALCLEEKFSHPSAEAIAQLKEE